MAKTSTQAKRKWNKENYTEFRAIVPKALGLRFKELCGEKGVSYNSILVKAVRDFVEDSEKQINDK